MKLLSILLTIFTLNLIQAPIYLKDNSSALGWAKKMTGDGSEQHVYNRGDYISQFIAPIRVIFRLKASSDDKSSLPTSNMLTIPEFLRELRHEQNADESLYDTAKRVYDFVRIQNERRYLYLILQGYCMQPLELETLLNIEEGRRLKPKNIEILGNRLVEAANPQKLLPHNLTMVLDGGEFQNVNLAQFVDILRDRAKLEKIRQIQMTNSHKFRQLRCEYSIGSKVECAHLSDLLEGPELLGKLQPLHVLVDSMDYLYIIEHSNTLGSVDKYVIKSPIGECPSVAVNMELDCGYVCMSRATILPIPSKSKFLHDPLPGKKTSGLTDEDLAFEYAHMALTTPYSVELFREHGINIFEFLDSNSMLVTDFSDSTLYNVAGGSFGLSAFVAMCSAIIKKHVNPEILLSGFMRYDGSLDPIGAAPAKARVALENGYKIFAAPQFSVNTQFGTEPFHAEHAFPQLEESDEVVHKVKHKDLQVHGIRGSGDVFKLAFGFQSSLDLSEQKMSRMFLLLSLHPQHISYFFYERGYFTKLIEGRETYTDLLKRLLCTRRKSQ